MKLLSAFISVVLISTSLYSQPAVVSEEIVVTASAVPEELDETPVAATVITREEIERREARDVSDVLREVPGITVARTGSAGKVASLFVRGGSSKQALVLWNGVEMNNPYFSGYNFGQLSTAGVQRVEVVRGPFSALYGSEAVSGVVNVLTTPRSSGATVDVEAGENGLLDAALHGALVRDFWSAYGTVERRRDDGFFENDEFASSSFMGGASLAPSAGLTLGVTARHSTYELSIPFAPNATYTAFEPRSERGEEGSETQIALPVRYDRGRMTYEARLAESRRDDVFADLESGEDSSTETRVRSLRVAAQVRGTALGTLTIGGEYEEAVVDHVSDFSLIDARERSNESIFVEDRLSFAAGPRSSVEITAGVRYDRFDTFGAETTPRVAAAWVREGHKLRAAYGESFRAPAIGELYSPYFGNPELDAERSNNAEVGYEHHVAEGMVGITLFRSRYDDLISFGAATFENIARASAEGIELAASRRLGRLDLGLSYTWLNAQDEATGAQLVRRPEHSGSLAIGYFAGAMSTQLVIAHTGARPDVTDVFPFGIVTNEAHTTADVTIRYALGKLVPYVKVDNLTDTRYEEVFGYASGRRRASVGLRYSM